MGEVVDVLGPLLLERAVPPPLHRYGKVFVGPVEAARGLSFDAVFVPELAERMFPRKIGEEPILLDTFREQISDALATNQSRLENERLTLALAVGGAETRICFSYPRLDLQAQPRPRVPPFTRWKPGVRPRNDCLILPSSPRMQKLQPLLASAGPDLLTLPIQR